MSAAQLTSLIERKARIGREQQAARAMSLGRALRLTAAKQADRLMGLALNTLGVTRTAASGEALADLLTEQALLLLMDGPDHQVCAVVLDADLVTGLIQQQTMGKVTVAQSGAAPRKFTDTDAALCAPFVEALMADASKLPEEAGDRRVLQGYRFGVRAQTPRAALLALDKLEYEAVCVTFDLAGGARNGTLTLILPKPVAAAAPEPDTRHSDNPPCPAGGRTLSKTVMELHADLTVALTRLRLPLQAVSGMKAGDVLDLKISSLAQAMVIDAGGKVVSRATLGQLDGMRAVQLEHKAAVHVHPRRRASDRDTLDLPDVTAHLPSGDETSADPGEVDIFDDAAQMPDIEMPDTDMAALWNETDASEDTYPDEDRRQIASG